MSESSPPNHLNIGSNPRHFRSQQGNAHRPFGERLSQTQWPNSGFSVSSSSSSENVHRMSPTSFQGSPMSYTPANVQYSQRDGFLSHYSLSTQTTPIPMAHGPTHYAYSPFHHPVLADNNMISHTMHPSYPPMLQPPPGTVFTYQPHSPDDNSPGHLSPFPIPPGTLMYPPSQISPSSQSSPQIPTTSGSVSPSYVGSNPFHPVPYPSPMAPNPYPYPPHSFTPPVYQSQYPPNQTFQRYPSSGEAGSQPTWYYLHRGPIPQLPYESGSSYQAQFPTSYPASGRQEAGTPVYDQHRSLTTGVASASPGIRPESQVSLDSPRNFGPGPGIPNSTLPPRSSPSGVNRPPDKPIVRRSYHPNPPAHRSEWVMWVGNVPSDATHDELWRFFNHKVPEHPVGGTEGTGVLSIFLISRSSCAFVNYKSNFFLEEAISRFNGVPLRPSDSRCPRLVCRVRRLDDDLKAGVGGQRGMGIHTKWIKDWKGKHRDVNVGIQTSDASLPSSPVSLSERMAAAISTVSMSSDENLEEKERRQAHAKHSSSSGSYASTNSSFLVRHFPKRYFILKSLTQVCFM